MNTEGKEIVVNTGNIRRQSYKNMLVKNFIVTKNILSAYPVILQ